MIDDAAAPKRSLIQLIAALPGLIAELVKAELEAFKEDMKRRAIRAGVGAGLFGAAALLALLALVVLVIAAIAGIATVLPLWASALIVFGALVILAGVLVVAGIAAFKSAKPDADRALDSIGDDFRTLRHDGRRAARAAARSEEG